MCGVRTSSVSECLHAIGVIGIRIHMVNTDRVGADGLHEGRVETTLCRVDEGIVGYQLVGDTCRLWSVAVLVSRAGVRTLDEELIALAGEELGALDLNGRNSRRDRTQASQ
jgi:hypothetical protein